MYSFVPWFTPVLLLIECIQCRASLVELKASVGLPGGVVLCRGLTRRVGITDI